MGDTWRDLQEIKNKKSSIREKMESRKRQRETLMANVVQTKKVSPGESSKPENVIAHNLNKVLKIEKYKGDDNDSVGRQNSFDTDKYENKLLVILMNLSTSENITNKLIRDVFRSRGSLVMVELIDSILHKFCEENLIKLISDNSEENVLYISSIDYAKISMMLDDKEDYQESLSLFKNDYKLENIENLLGAQTAKEKETKRINDEINYLLDRPSAKEQSLIERFRSQRGSNVQQFCHYGTIDECSKVNEVCNKLHFRKIIQAHTDESLGDCSFLNTCFHIETCKYVHYEINQPDGAQNDFNIDKYFDPSIRRTNDTTTLYQPQWIDCDIRELDMSVLGKFAVIMADPPWDIHMELPYGTMSDEEMSKLDIPCLQTEGYIFLWVTGRAMEQGRECLRLWGYQCLEEIIWVKTNQLQRIIRTGRTGHWLNHGKEHCLVGVKGNPKGMNRGLDCDVIVSEVRETSHKPDEIYGMIERLSPGTRKLELFGRPHNLQPNWITLGNQLEGTKLVDPEVVERFRKKYPDGLKCSKKP